MTGDSRMFNSIKSNDGDGVQSITFGEHFQYATSSELELQPFIGSSTL
jgi:hypothetical protein